MTSLAKESVKRLGPSADLITLLPTTVLLVSLVAIYVSDLYPWLDDHKKPDAGVDSVVASLDKLNLKDGIAFTLALLVAAVLIRPLHVAAVQLLEGYWSDRVVQSVARDLAVEYHQRRFGRAFARRTWDFDPGDEDPNFDVVVRQSRLRSRADRGSRAGSAVVDAYPSAQSAIMPTLLGNVLKRAETSAGERYKNSGVQIAFRTSWAAQSLSAAPKPALCQTSQPDTAIITYRTVHTGARASSAVPRPAPGAAGIRWRCPGRRGRRGRRPPRRWRPRRRMPVAPTSGPGDVRAG